MYTFKEYIEKENIDEGLVDALKGLKKGYLKTKEIAKKAYRTSQAIGTAIQQATSEKAAQFTPYELNELKIFRNNLLNVLDELTQTNKDTQIYTGISNNGNSVIIDIQLAPALKSALAKTGIPTGYKSKDVFIKELKNYLKYAKPPSPVPEEPPASEPPSPTPPAHKSEDKGEYYDSFVDSNIRIGDLKLESFINYLKNN